MSFQFQFAIIVFFLSSTAYAQWVRIEAIPPNTNVPSIYIEGNTIYAGADSVIYISSDGGTNWRKSNSINSAVDFVSSVVKIGNRIFVGTYNYGVYESTDFGLTWIERNEGLTNQASKTLADLVARGDSLYAGTIGAGVFVRSLISNTSWIPFNNGLIPNLSYNVNSLIKSGDILYAGAGGNGYYYTNKLGSNVWNEVQFGLISVKPLTFFDIIMKGGRQFIGSSYGLYESTDNGLSWNNLNLVNGYFETANFQGIDDNVYVAFAKSTRTLWLRLNSATNQWEFFDEQLGVNVLNIGYINNKLFAGRLDGLWYLTIPPAGIIDNESPSEYLLYNNYPNPFNSTTKIRFTIPDVGTGLALSALKVYDMLGNEVATLVDEYKSAGVYEVNFDPASGIWYQASGIELASGVYYYQLRVGDFVSTKKMVYLR